MRISVFIAIFLLVGNCRPGVEPLSPKTYTAEKIGWTIKLPGKKWKILTDHELRRMADINNAITEAEFGIKIDNSQKENLINLRKDNSTYFLASIEPFDSVSFKDYDEMLRLLHQGVQELLKSKKIRAEYETGATRIDGLWLDRYNIKIYMKQNNGKVFQKEIYTCLINNYVLSITLIYNNETDKEVLVNILQSSNFTMNSNP